MKHKKLYITLGVIAVIGIVGYATKSHWMPLLQGTPSLATPTTPTDSKVVSTGANGQRWDDKAKKYNSDGLDNEAR